MWGRFVVRGFAALLGACLIGAPGAASASDVPLAGRTMRLADGAKAAKRRNLVRLQAPTLDLTGIDPTVTGATAHIGRAGSPTFTALALPADGWSAVGSASRPGFKFKSGTAAVRAARIGGRSLRLKARGAEAYALGGVVQHEVAVIVAIGDVRFCGSFGGDVARDDGTRFRAENAPAPDACPAAASSTTTIAAPTTTSSIATETSTTSTTSTSAESTSTTSTTLIDCSAPAGANARPDGCPCDGNNDCCAVCGGSIENPICGGIRKPGAPLACFGPECQYPSGANSRAAGCPCAGNNDCCAVCGGSIEHPICGGNVKPSPPAVCTD